MVELECIHAFLSATTDSRIKILLRVNTSTSIEGGEGGGGEETGPDLESVLATPLWGMLYADDAGRGRLATTRAAEEDDRGDRGRVRDVWPHSIEGQD